MTTVTISTSEPRSLRAVAIAAGAGQWLPCRASDGRKAYEVPSQRPTAITSPCATAAIARTLVEVTYATTVRLCGCSSV
jgi:hypothetical protein